MVLARLLSLEKSPKGVIKLLTALKLPISAELLNGMLEERLSGAVACSTSPSNASIGNKTHGCLPAAENNRALELSILLPLPRLPFPQFSKQEKSEEKAKMGGWKPTKSLVLEMQRK